MPASSAPDRFAVPPTLATQPNYADRFAVPDEIEYPFFDVPRGRHGDAVPDEIEYPFFDVPSINREPAAPAPSNYANAQGRGAPINYATASPYVLSLLANRGVGEAAEEFRRRYSGDVVPEGAMTFREYLGSDKDIGVMRGQEWTPDFMRNVYEDYLAGFVSQ